MPRRVKFSLLWLLSLAVASTAIAQSEFKPRPGATPSPTPVVIKPRSQGAAARGRVTTRIAVGERAPDFELLTLKGKPVRLSSLRGQWVMLYFVERRDSLESVEPVAKALDTIGVRTVVVCYDKLQAIEHRLKGHAPSYLPLADPTGAIVALYGLLDAERERSQPGFVLVTPSGNVRLALLGHDMPSDDASRLVHLAVRGE